MTPEEIFNKLPHLGRDGHYFHLSQASVIDAMKKYAQQEVNGKWIPVSNNPKISQEYVVTIDLEDSEPVISMAMDYEVNQDKWYYPGTIMVPHGNILYYQERPTPFPVVIVPEPIIQKPLTVDEYERTTYGQCVHGENLANCTECNKK